MDEWRSENLSRGKREKFQNWESEAESDKLQVTQTRSDKPNRITYYGNLIVNENMGRWERFPLNKKMVNSFMCVLRLRLFKNSRFPRALTNISIP